jgi:hypothetical protein
MIRRFDSFGALAAHLVQVQADMQNALRQGLEHVAPQTEADAQAAISASGDPAAEMPPTLEAPAVRDGETIKDWVDRVATASFNCVDPE